MLFKISLRTDHGIPLRQAEGDHDHVVRNETCRAHAEIETVSNDIHQTAFGDEVDVYFRMMLQELHHQGHER
ncbi:hypothetical protein D3C84_1143190 [compost metagenome]